MSRATIKPKSASHIPMIPLDLLPLFRESGTVSDALRAHIKTTIPPPVGSGAASGFEGRSEEALGPT